MKFKNYIVIFMAFVFLIVNSSITAIAKAKPITIKSISDLNVQIVQNTKYTLPKTVTAIMSNNTKKNVAVKWNVSKVTTSKAGMVQLKDIIKGLY